MAAAKPEPKKTDALVLAVHRPPIAVQHVKHDLAAASRQIDALIGEVRRLQGIVHELEAQAAF